MPADRRNDAANADIPSPVPQVATELSRTMGLLHVVMIGVGAMIGAGIFVLTGIAAGVAGPALILVFLLNGVVTTLTALSYAELGSCFPEAGGGYLRVKQALPQPSGFLSGWMSWFARAVACSLYAVAFGAFATKVLSLLPPLKLRAEAKGSKEEESADAESGDDLAIEGLHEGVFHRNFFGEVPERLAYELANPVILTKKYPGHVISRFQMLFGSRMPVPHFDLEADSAASLAAGSRSADTS